MKNVRITISPLILILFLSILMSPLKIQAQMDDGHMDNEISGQIQSIGQDSLVINSKTFFADSTTEVRNQLHSVLSFNDLRQGDFVEINYIKRQDSTFFASRITLKTQENEFEISGVVRYINQDSIAVHSMVFFTDSTTIIRGNTDSTLTLDQIKPGDFVEILGVRMGFQSFFAKRITVRNENEEEKHKIEIEGTIDAISGDTISVDGTKITVNNQTMILSREHLRLAFNDLTVGTKVEVKAQMLSDSTLLAIVIKVEASEHNWIEIIAPIDSLINNSLIVSGINFNVDSTTSITDAHGNSLTFNDLAKGMIVCIKGEKINDSTYLAKRIKIRELWRHRIEVRGIIDTVGNDYLVVNQKRFNVDSNTEVFDSTNAAIPFSSLQAGQKVMIQAEVKQDHQLLAKRIMIIGTRDADIVGVISDINGDTLTVSGLKVVVNSFTHYFNEADSSVTFSDLAVNQTVEVGAILKPAGFYLAYVIKIEDDPNISQVTGSISAVSNSSVTVSSPNYIVTSSTVVIDQNYQPINISDLSAGQQVTVWFTTNNLNQTEAIQIQSSTSSATGISSTETVPGNYKLMQNYPNPFNPSTVIRYTIPQQGLVSLKVYDILGKEVATLVNEVKTAGTYDIQFNAARLASGVYFYRIQAGNFVSTKKLILLK